MPDDYVDLNSNVNGEQESSEDEEKLSSWGVGRWAHVFSGVAFCLVYFPLKNHVWSLQVAITIAYLVFMIFCTFGLAFRDSDDLLGDVRVSRYLAVLLGRQIVVLALVSLGACLWVYLRHVLPTWLAQDGRRLSLWDYFGIIVFYVIAVREAMWMAGKIKKEFPDLAQPDEKASS